METLLELKGIHKYFPGVHALKGVDFQVNKGEVHSLMGENGAGKSTLIKIISGVFDIDRGEYFFEGKKVNIRNVSDAIACGISVIHQELNLCENVSIAENIYMGRFQSKLELFIDRKRMFTETVKYLELVGLKLDPGTSVEYLSTAQKQLVEIARAISYDAKIIIMDEPTSALSPKESRQLFETIMKLKADGVAIIYISHKIDEIFEVSDRVTILRDGQFICTKEISELSREELIKNMVGREICELYKRSEIEPGDTVLQVSNLINGNIKNASFYVKAGEIVGFSGLMGAGRTELAKAVYGFDSRESGEVLLRGKEVRANSTSSAKKVGIGYVPEDRKLEGIFPSLSVRKNITITSLRNLSKAFFINRKKESESVYGIVDDLRIKTPGIEQLIEKLSGGNQQKVILSRWLINTDIKVLIIDEPTRGIDVGAKSEIYAILDKLSHKGMAIIIMSSEMPEILCMCDRIYVMKNGKITGELMRAEASQEKLLQYAIN